MKTRSWNFLFSRHTGELPVVLLYCSSAGEYEQASPLARQFEEKGYEPIYIFFSVNGLQHASSQQENYKMHMAPYDSFFTWFIFLLKFRPKSLTIIKHEFWPCCIAAAALFSKVNAVLIPLKNRNGLRQFVQNSLLKLFDTLHFISYKEKDPSDFYYDTRPHQIDFKVKNGYLKLTPFVEWKSNICKSGELLLVMGNAYLSDAEQLLRLGYFDLLQTIKIIIVPHNTFESQRINSYFTDNIPSHFDCINTIGLETNKSILIISVYGQLLWIYSIADVIWIGGGFGKGVHSIWEPAYFNVPLVCGPHLNDEPDALFFNKNGMLYDPSYLKENFLSLKESFKLPGILYLEHLKKPSIQITKLV